jgi:hypothetical protein
MMYLDAYLGLSTVRVVRIGGSGARHVENEGGSDKVCVNAVVEAVCICNVRSEGHYHHQGVAPQYSPCRDFHRIYQQSARFQLGKPLFYAIYGYYSWRDSRSVRLHSLVLRTNAA